jgi:hypothetical protein
MAKDKGPWKDAALRSLARRPVALPLDVSELTHAALRRRLWRVLGILTGGEFIALALLFAILGVLPGFIDRGSFGSLEPGAETALLGVLFGVPLVSALVIYVLVHRRVRRRPDEDDHPWRFQATESGLTVGGAGGWQRRAGWSAWRYAGYDYILVKMNRIPTGLRIALDGREIEIELSRFRRREAFALAAAVLREMGRAGQSDA